MTKYFYIFFVFIGLSSCSHSGEKSKSRIDGNYRRQLDQIVLQNKPKFQKCYEFLSKKTKAATKSKLVVDWRIDKDGTTTRFEVNEYKSSAINLEISECLKNEFAGISFPVPPSGVAAVQISDYAIKIE